MLNNSRKIMLGLGAALLLTTAGTSHADSRNLFQFQTFQHQDFGQYPIQGLNENELLELNRYINYEKRESCENYRNVPSPFQRSGCKLFRGERLDYTLYFDTNSSAIRSGEAAMINKIVKAYRTHNPREVVLVGHTDTQGSSSSNEALSMRRAEAVASALQAKGISSRVIQGDAKGEYDLAVDTGDNVANQLNRRVSVHLIR